MRADWPIVAAAWLITVLSAVLFASGVIYPAAAAEAGLQRALRDAPLASKSLDIARYDTPENAPAVDARVAAAVQDVIAGGGSLVRDWRRTATLPLAARTGAAVGDQADFGYLEGIADHATLVGGAWPQEDVLPADSVIDVVLAKPAADALGLHVGDLIDVVNQPKPPFRLIGIYEPRDPTEPYWNADVQLTTGLHENAQYHTFGPLLASRTVVLAAAGTGQLNLHWRVYPDFDALAVDDAGALAGRIDAIPLRTLADGGPKVTINSQLSAILRDADRSLLVSRTSVVLLMAQLALLAGYAIVLMATLLVDHRRVDTALLRARGAGMGHVALLSFVEALVFAGTAAAIAPTLAAGAVGLFNVIGPLADVGLGIVPQVTSDAYLAAGAAGLLCVVLLVLPAALSARAFAQEQGGRSRQETRTLGQRMGLDIVLIAITAIALWQLRLYGAPLTRSVQGQLGLDPLLVAAPAIGLIAGGVLALRLLPLFAQLMERGVARGRGLLTSLGARQLARRPLRYTRSALLLVLAVSMGVFALSYAATWAGSQRDQAIYQAGADVRMAAAATPAGLPTWALAGALADQPDVAAATPVERITDGVKFAATGSADLLALDAATAGKVVLLRDDATATPFNDLLQPLLAARPAPKLAQLPAGTSVLRVVPATTVTKAEQFVPDSSNPDGGTTEPLDPASVAVSMSATVVLQDAHGLLYQFRSTVVPVSGAKPEIVIPLQQGVAGSGAPLHLDEPVSIASLGVEVWLPDLTIIDGASFGVAAVGSASADAGPWTDVPLSGAGPWSAGYSQGHQIPDDVPGTRVKDVTVTFSGEDANGAIFGNGTFATSAILGFLPNGIDATGGALPVIVNRAFATAYDANVGEVVTASVAGRFSRLSIAGIVDTFPTTNPTKPLAIVDEASMSLLRLRTITPTRPVDEWWLAARPGAADALATALSTAPFDRPDLVSATGRARALSTDPVALGIIGALTLGFVTTGLFAIVGMTVSAGVSARQQRTEFALLRALGLSGRQLSGSLWLEHGTVVVLGLLAGTALGLLISWLVLPFVTVTQGGVTPVPSVLIEVPWDRVLVLNLASAGALAVAVVVIGTVLRRLRVGATLRMGEE
ncbi:MAG TPA: FtsX-like permease family protein [Candidatus Limnocylindrales bacterium]|nr:FtsX-like permease family protein [Candidatus Limnocylindrales bacterium]